MDDKKLMIILNKSQQHNYTKTLKYEKKLINTGQRTSRVENVVSINHLFLTLCLRLKQQQQHRKQKQQIRPLEAFKAKIHKLSYSFQDHF